MSRANDESPDSAGLATRAWLGRLGIAACVLVAACDSTRYEPGSARQVLGVPMGVVRSAIAARLDSGGPPSWVSRDDWGRVRRLYGVFNEAPLWLEPDGVKDRASALLDALNAAPTHGLSTSSYPIDSIRRVVAADDIAKGASATVLANVDVLLTAAYVAYASDMLIGQVDPKTVAQAWHIPAQKTEVDSALARTLQSSSMQSGLADIVPQDPAYAALLREYARYQQIVASGGWATPVDAETAAVLARLRAEGYAVDSTLAGLRQALRTFQERHGLAPTGSTDRRTLAAMSVPAIERVHQIASNLERHRWLPRTLGTRYIYVNVPAFRLEVYDSSQKKLEMKIVVGAEYDGRATPVFADSMEFVVFRPYWNVPPNIAAKEFFPKYGTNLPAGFETWRENGELRIRQRPGDKNALGLVKFMFPNNFNIYLHDTPEKSLFGQTDRAASHGCIRLEKPTELAEFVLHWPRDRVAAAMDGPANRTVTLPQKIPVYIVYFTAYVRDGQLYFTDDLYDRDDALDMNMDTSAVHVAPPRRPAKSR